MVKKFYLIILLMAMTMVATAQEKETMVVLTTEYGTMKIKERRRGRIMRHRSKNQRTKGITL